MTRAWVQYSFPRMNCCRTHGLSPEIGIPETCWYVSLIVLLGRILMSPLVASSMPTLFIMYFFFVLGDSLSTLCTAALDVTLCVSGVGSPSCEVCRMKMSFSCSVCVVRTSNCMHLHSDLCSITSFAWPSSTADATPEQLTHKSTFSLHTIRSSSWM